MLPTDPVATNPPKGALICPTVQTAVTPESSMTTPGETLPTGLSAPPHEPSPQALIPQPLPVDTPERGLVCWLTTAPDVPVAATPVPSKAISGRVVPVELVVVTPVLAVVITANAVPAAPTAVTPAPDAVIPGSAPYGASANADIPNMVYAHVPTEVLAPAAPMG